MTKQPILFWLNSDGILNPGSPVQMNSDRFEGALFALDLILFLLVVGFPFLALLSHGKRYSLVEYKQEFKSCRSAEKSRDDLQSTLQQCWQSWELGVGRKFSKNCFFQICIADGWIRLYPAMHTRKCRKMWVAFSVFVPAS